MLSRPLLVEECRHFGLLVIADHLAESHLYDLQICGPHAIRESHYHDSIASNMEFIRKLAEHPTDFLILHFEENRRKRLENQI